MSPKVASSSIRAVIHRFDYPDQPLKEWKKHLRENELATVPFDRVDTGAYEGFTRIALVRDPVARFFSAYADLLFKRKLVTAKLLGERWRTKPSVLQREYNIAAAESMPPRQIGRQMLERHGLTANPDIATLIERFADYSALFDQVHHHMRPQRDFLGSDLGYYDRVFQVERMADVARVSSGPRGRAHRNSPPAHDRTALPFRDASRTGCEGPARHHEGGLRSPACALSDAG